ncbi:S24 family peptidase [Candidatus Vondammii sp. HM_W22]|uniref:S24 family peptidase n=1 Tax=Candidatus Vondammii sp. HM_W22 TaxID=2687299 RepID=UPI002E7C3AEF|nr:S24 family peptidase [Candidatus Vondammii sp. HM_W22]
MGKGIPADLEHDTVVSQVSVNTLWIRENLSTISSPSNLSMITGHGDSMEGTFNHGDVLFVDTGIDEIKMDAVYVLNLNDELYIKRLQRKPDGSMLMIYDNAKYQPYVIQNGEKDKVQILGRIVGIWNFRRVLSMSDDIKVFIYQNARGNITARSVNNVSESDDYIQGICTQANALRTFRKDRILEDFAADRSDTVIQEKLVYY